MSSIDLYIFFINKLSFSFFPFIVSFNKSFTNYSCPILYLRFDIFYKINSYLHYFKIQFLDDLLNTDLQYYIFLILCNFSIISTKSNYFHDLRYLLLENNLVINYVLPIKVMHFLYIYI